MDKGLIDGGRVRYIPGNAPELVMFDMTGKEKERINLEKMSVTEIKMLLASHGFAERARKVEL